MIRRMTTTLEKIRARRGVTVDAICEAVGTHRTNYYRIERGEQLPRREVARAIYDFFDGEVALEDIYDPRFAALTRRRRAG